MISQKKIYIWLDKIKLPFPSSISSAYLIYSILINLYMFLFLPSDANIFLRYSPVFHLPFVFYFQLLSQDFFYLHFFQCTLKQFPTNCRFLGVFGCRVLGSQLPVGHRTLPYILFQNNRFFQAYSSKFKRRGLGHQQLCGKC